MTKYKYLVNLGKGVHKCFALFLQHWVKLEIILKLNKIRTKTKVKVREVEGNQWVSLKHGRKHFSLKSNVSNVLMVFKTFL